MAHIGRTVKNVEAPRPLKSQSRSSLKNNFMLIEELIQLIENVALSLQSGINNTEPMATLVQNLRIHGPQLETVSKDTLDRAFVVFRNASQDERLNIMTRLNLLELIELRAKGWEDNGINSYYKTKQATNAELNDVQNHVDPTQTAFLSTSPTFSSMNAMGNAAAAAAIAAVGSANQQHLLLSPGEVIRNSGKFPKPTKIPGKTYCKDEVVIRNADSGKVNPGAKERLVQITGPAEDKINYAKQLIEDTIRRNASPVRLDPAMNSGHAGGGGSCSSLASSNSDEAVQPRTPGASNIANRLSFNSAQNFMTAAAAAATQQMVQQQQHLANVQSMNNSTNVSNAAAAAAAAVAGKPIRPHSQMLLHSYSTNDASLGEYKFTCNVGQHVIKITGDCCDLVRVAKLVLDDYFSSAEFLASIEAGAAFDGSIVSPISTPSTPMTGAPQFVMGTPLTTDSGIGLNYMSSTNSNNQQDGDDDVFVEGNNLSKSASQSNGLARSRRSHFSRKDSTPEATSTPVAPIVRQKSEIAGGTANNNNNNSETTRIVHQYEHLLYYAKSPHSWALPSEWHKICEKFPAIIRNKVKTTHASYNIATTTNATATVTNSATTNSPTTSTIYNNNIPYFPSTTITTNTNTKASCYSSLPLRVASHNAAHLSISTSNSTNTTFTATTTCSAIITSTSISNQNKILNSNEENNYNLDPQLVVTDGEMFAKNVTNNDVYNYQNNNNNNLKISYKIVNNTNTTNHNNINNNNNPKDYITMNEKYLTNNNLNTTPQTTTTPFKTNFYGGGIGGHLTLNIKRKGFFNRLTYSIDEDGCYNDNTTASTTTTIMNNTTSSVDIATTTSNNGTLPLTITGGSGRLNNININRQLISIRTGPMTSVPYPSPSAPEGGCTPQKLLHKQMKIISDIMVESRKTGGNNSNNKSMESLKGSSNNDSCKISNEMNDNVVVQVDDDDGDIVDNVVKDVDNDVEIIGVSNGPAGTIPPSSLSQTMSRPKLSYEFRSYSTCD